MLIMLYYRIVIESKPDNATDDLRIAQPFPALVEFSQKFRLDELNSADHSHVPYIVLLVQFARQWREEVCNRIYLCIDIDLII
jgi:amyloid beta precursor protein binding protein 1